MGHVTEGWWVGLGQVENFMFLWVGSGQQVDGSGSQKKVTHGQLNVKVRSLKCNKFAKDL